MGVVVKVKEVIRWGLRDGEGATGWGPSILWMGKASLGSVKYKA